MKIKLSNGTYLKAHKFVLDARSKNWNSQNLSIISELDLSGKFLRIYLIKVTNKLITKIKEVNYDIGFNLIKWVYTDTIESSHKSNEDFYLEMMKQAGHFNLKELKLK